MSMSMEEFIEQNRARIYNIDGNLDEGDISVMGDDMVLTFYYFKDGVRGVEVPIEIVIMNLCVS